MTTPNTDHHLPTAPSPLMQRHVLARVENKLAQRFADEVPADAVRATVRAVVADLKAEARLTTFLPALAEHEAGRRLREAAHAAALGVAQAA